MCGSFYFVRYLDEVQMTSCSAVIGRYLVNHLMGADLNNIVKCQKLTDDHVQFLIYQILRGLKVKHCAQPSVLRLNKCMFRNLF